MENNLEWLLPTGDRVDLNNCDREPIHVPEAIQRHGLLLAVSPHDQTVERYSANAPDRLGLEPSALLGASLETLLGREVSEWARSAESGEPPRLIHRRCELSRPKGAFDVVAHRFEDRIVVELESALPVEDLLDLSARVDEATARIAECAELERLNEEAPRIVADLLGFDRIMLYRFVTDGAGVVVGEVHREGMESYLGLRYPATDIPQQARRLYVLNRVRGIFDSRDPGFNLLPSPRVGEARLNLAFAQTRAVSPVHLEYLRNMGVRASLSASIVIDGWLDGLIACHHSTPVVPAYPVRLALATIARAVAAQLRHLENERARRAQITRQSIQLLFLRHFVVKESPLEALQEAAADALTLVSADAFIAEVPGGQVVQGDVELAETGRVWASWLLREEPERVVVTDQLAADYPGFKAESGKGEPLPAEPAGLVLVPLKDLGFLAWLRVEHVRTVAWGGKPPEKTGDAPYLSPRKSFSRWEETVRNRSLPWQDVEIDVARVLHRAILRRLGAVGEEAQTFDEILVTMTRYIEQLERSNDDLERFAYAASHDLQAPLRTIRGFIDLIEMGLEKHGGLPEEVAPLWPPVVRGTETMRALLSGLLDYSRVGRIESTEDEIDVERLVEKVREGLGHLLTESGGEIHVGPLPRVRGSWPHMHILFQNLLENALKYARPGVPAVVKVSARRAERRWMFTVSDNGVGIPKDQLPYAFELFKRLHPEKTPGTGIGLPLCKRIVTQHGGTLTAQSEVGVGSVFEFTLPAAS